MTTQSKLRKKSFTIVEQACHQIRGFRNLYQELDDKVRLSGQSHSTLNNYARKLAQLSLHFGKLPQHIGEKEMNKYLASLARQSKAPSLSDFKFAVYGLRYCYRLLGMSDKIVQLPSIKRENKLPVVLNLQECKALFNDPELLKHRILLALMYSAGLRATRLHSLSREAGLGLPAFGRGKLFLDHTKSYLLSAGVSLFLIQTIDSNVFCLHILF